jgi:hypothetical protein
MFLVLTHERNSEMLSTVFTVQNAYNFPVVVVTLIVDAEAEVVIVVARGMVEEEEVIRVMYAGRTHEMLRFVIIIMNLKTQE